jgi:uncharacterized tellurite resistance protein B-like protein
MVFRWLTGKTPAGAAQNATALEPVIRTHMAGADDDAVRIVTAIAGLLAAVAYADRKYSEVEEQRIRAELARVEGLKTDGVDAICAVLREHVAEISAVEAPVHARNLLDLADRDLRLRVLDALVDLAAADDEITVAETNTLRLTATALGLSQDDYNASQARHRDKLTVLKVREPRDPH